MISAGEKLRKLSIDECKTLQDGEMREVKYGTKDDESILVVMYQGKLRALSNHCPHFGAPMHTGLLIDNVIKCPWHGASFDILTGKTDISPSINDLTTYEVLQDENGFYVNLPEKVLKQVVPKMSKRDPEDKRKFVIIGGGPAGLSAAEALRQGGYTGEITIISKDKHVPYDRTILSKFLPDSISKFYLRSPEFLNEYDIDVLTGSGVMEVDKVNRIVKLEGGQEYSYDKLLVATGGSPLVPRVPGSNKPHVHLLRTFEDRVRIEEACKNAKNIVIVGASFIGMESASCLKRSYPNARVTVVDRAPSPFFASLGKEVGSALQK